MTRSIILAILAFSLLILTNIAVFSYLIFGDLSEAMVTERLVKGIDEARGLILREMEQNISRELDQRALTEKVAPRLRKFVFFRAIVVRDSRGKIIHREFIGGEIIARQQPRAEKASLEDRPVVVPVSYQDQQRSDTSLGLEYSEGAVAQEVAKLRKELNRKLAIAIALSLLLLSAGLAYVIWAYRRNRYLRDQAQKADRLAYVGTLAGSLAHEIRNPLNSMNMNVQLVQEELGERNFEGAGDLNQMLEAIRKEVMRLERLVSSFLAYARPTQITTKPIQINEVLNGTLEFLDREIEQRGILLDTQFDPDLPAIDGDESQLRQAFLNIILNGIQVMNPQEHLTIITRRENGNQISVAIQDEGPGISAQELKNIFKVFYSTRVGGTGLGLPIAQRIAELHDGHIDVESTIGQGTTFRFKFPYKQLPA